MTTKSLEVVPMSIRIYQAHRDIIEQAAALVEGRTLSDYVREVLVAHAADELGVEVPAVPEITRGRAGSLAAQAAARLGVSKQEFEREAIRLMAAQTLGASAELTGGRTPGSGQRHAIPIPRKPSGAYSSRPPEGGGTTRVVRRQSRAR